jgi:hypothetical protein
MNNSQYTQELPSINGYHSSEIPLNHPFPLWNGIRTPESKKLLETRSVKTKVNPTEGLEEALL